MNTWLEDFHTKTDLNKYPVALRTRGGVGYKKPNGEIVSNFVGHPVHYFDNGIWKPITLKAHSNGDFEGSEYSWRGNRVLHKGKTLFTPKAVFLDGVRHNLKLRQEGNRIVADLPFGQYEIIFSERGVKELLTIPHPIEGLLEFDVPHDKKPQGLYKKDRHIVGGVTAESFQLTKDMKYPLVIDPDYSADSNDTAVYGVSSTRTTARSTSVGFDTTSASVNIIVQRYGGSTYQYNRYFVKFDTSGIPDGDTVSNAVMKLTPTNKMTDTNIYIRAQDWSAQDPISAGNREAAYDGCLSASNEALWAAVSSLTVNVQYTSDNLDTTRVSKTGSTYYSLITQMDIDDTNFSSDITYGAAIASQNHATSAYRPVLTVTHAAVLAGSFWFM